MTQTQPLGPVLHSFFASHLITVKGLRPASVRSYRDTVRLLLVFTAADNGCKITRLALTDLTFDRIVAFLRHLEQDRGNHPRTRNQRLAALKRESLRAGWASCYVVQMKGQAVAARSQYRVIYVLS